MRTTSLVDLELPRLTDIEAQRRTGELASGCCPHGGLDGFVEASPRRRAITEIEATRGDVGNRLRGARTKHHAIATARVVSDARCPTQPEVVHRLAILGGHAPGLDGPDGVIASFQAHPSVVLPAIRGSPCFDHARHGERIVEQGVIADQHARVRELHRRVGWHGTLRSAQAWTFPRRTCHRRAMSYISSGKLRADVERVTGTTLQKDADADEPEDGEDDAFTRFSGELRTELEALRALAFGFSPPKLCVLRWGDFCSVPELTGEERDDVLEDWFDGDEAATDFVMAAVDIVNGGGGFYFVVHPDGRMGLVCEDPHSFDPLDCTVQQFLEALVAGHEAAYNHGLDAAKAELTKVVDEGTADMMLTFANRLTPEARGA